MNLMMYPNADVPWIDATLVIHCRLWRWRWVCTVRGASRRSRRLLRRLKVYIYIYISMFHCLWNYRLKTLIYNLWVQIILARRICYNHYTSSYYHSYFTDLESYKFDVALNKITVTGNVTSEEVFRVLHKIGKNPTNWTED